MYNNRTIDHLQSFDKKDWKLFKKYLSEKIKPGTEIHSLIVHIFQHQDQLNHKHLAVDYIHHNIFPSKSRKSILNLFSQLTIFIRDFLILQQLEIDHHLKKVLLLQALNKRKLYQEADKMANLMTKELENTPLEYFNSLYKQLINHHQYFSDNPIKYTPMGAQILQTSIDELINYEEHLRSLYFLETQSRIIMNAREYGEIQNNYSFNKESKDPLVTITYHLYQTRINGSFESAEYLKLLLNKEHAKFSDELRMNIYIILRMYYARKANLGDHDMAYEVFKLHKLIVENSYFEYEGQVDPKRLIPVVELSVFLSEIEWVEHFIKKYEDKLNVTNKVITLKIAKAFICFGKKQYEDALDILNQLYPKDIYYKNIVLRLTLISYLELYLDDIHFVQQKIDNFKLFYYRNKRFLSKRVYESSNNLIKIIQWILQDKDSEFIKSRMAKMQFIFYRLYIFSKLTERKSAQSN